MGRKTSPALGGASAFPALLLVSLLLSACLFRRPQRYSDFITPTPLPPQQTLVIGFLGGRQPWNNAREGTRRLALKLRAMNLPGVDVETVENARRPLALELIRNAFDRDQDGQLDEGERRQVRLVLYGQSFGGAAVVKLARELQAIDIPVLLTVQIDSVGRDDAEIPPNVRAAANLHQQDGLLIRGEKEIRARDPSKTQILGNFRFRYQDKQADMSDVTWHKRLLRDAHAKMDRDPDVWAKAESLILGIIQEQEERLTSHPAEPEEK